MTVRLATEADAAGCLAVYAPYVRETAVTFETEPPTVEELARRIAAAQRHSSWWVADVAGHVAGYAYATRFRDRAAYDWAAEVTVYVDAAFHRRQLARQLYGALLDGLIQQGFCAALAGIALPNEASVRLHEGFGFRQVGLLPNVGFKHGRWHDVGWWHRQLAPPTSPPPVVKARA